MVYRKSIRWDRTHPTAGRDQEEFIGRELIPPLEGDEEEVKEAKVLKILTSKNY